MDCRHTATIKDRGGSTRCLLCGSKLPVEPFPDVKVDDLSTDSEKPVKTAKTGQKRQNRKREG